MAFVKYSDGTINGIIKSDDKDAAEVKSELDELKKKIEEEKLKKDKSN